MKNVVVGYRKMIGLTQAEMAKELQISELTYRNKEKGRTAFKDREMAKFHQLLLPVLPSITIEDIFFAKEPTYFDVKGGVEDAED